MSLKRFSQNIRPGHLWLFIMLSGFAASLIALIYTRGEAWTRVTFGRGLSYFDDFFAHVFYTADPENVYFASHDAVFPPFSYIFYRLIYLILPAGTLYDTNPMHVGAYGCFLYALYLALMVWAVTLLSRRMLRARTPAFSALASFLLLFSHSFTVGAIERGNSVFAALALLLFALALDQSGGRAKREAALILIAFASGIKVYAAAFGLLYIVQKRWREAARLVVYGLIVFFAPFAFFGGASGLRQFFVNQADALEGLRAVHTVNGLVSYAANALGISGAAGALSVAATAAFALVALFFLYRAKRLELQLIWIVSLVVLLPRWTGLYTFIYFALPLLCFLGDADKKWSAGSALYAVAYALLFVLIIAGSVSPPVNYLGVYMLLLLAAAEELRDMRVSSRIPR